MNENIKRVFDDNEQMDNDYIIESIQYDRWLMLEDIIKAPNANLR